MPKQWNVSFILTDRGQELDNGRMDYYPKRDLIDDVILSIVDSFITLSNIHVTEVEPAPRPRKPRMRKPQHIPLTTNPTRRDASRGRKGKV